MTAWPPDNSLLASLTGYIGSAMLLLMGARRIASWDELRRRLSNPQTILCLGNGPSSEAPALEDLSFDSLFRVNWVWRDRGRHANPNLVFTADFDAPPSGTAPIICFPTRKDANRILAGFARQRVGLPVEYVVFPEQAPELPRAWSYRPTNGALMVAAAVQLRPSRLVVAGIDLYRHPDGKYPGSANESNDYDAIHHRDIDLAFIRAALNQFDGEVELLSEQLWTALGN